MIRHSRDSQKGIVDIPNMIQDYIITDFADYVPYFMVSDTNNSKVGIDNPKFLNFGITECSTRSLGYMQPGDTITYRCHSCQVPYRFKPP